PPRRRPGRARGKQACPDSGSAPEPESRARGGCARLLLLDGRSRPSPAPGPASRSPPAEVVAPGTTIRAPAQAGESRSSQTQVLPLLSVRRMAVPGGTLQASARSKPARQRIIEAAADLFHQQGVAATSPNQIMALSRTGKNQLYHYFQSKAGLVHQVLQHHIDSIREGTAAIDYEVSSWTDLGRWLRAHAALQARYAMTRGCPFGSIGNELTGSDELVRQDLALLFE